VALSVTTPQFKKFVTAGRCSMLANESNLGIHDYMSFVTQRYPKIRTNMFVIEHQAASFSVWSVASISQRSFW
jgi:hypothetical protein